LAIPSCFRLGDAGTGLFEMELTTATEEDDSIAAQRSAGFSAIDGGRSPIENPAIESIPDDPLLEPHPGEPGVHSDGTAAPLENPDDSVSADPLLGTV
jgi:hypothetical protein